METCRSCGAAVRWASLNGRPHPVDRVERADGNLRLTWIEGNLFAFRLGPGERFAGPRYISHFATCPQAATWRKRDTNNNDDNEENETMGNEYDDEGMFDPTADDFNVDESSRQDFGEETLLVRAGVFLVAGVFFHEMRTTQAGNMFARVKFEVIFGKHKGERFWDSIFVHGNALKRLAQMCRAMRYTQRFKPTDEDQLRHALIGRPFLAKTKIERGTGQYEDAARIAFYELRSWTPQEEAAAIAWKADFDRQREEKEYGGESQSEAKGKGAKSEDEYRFEAGADDGPPADIGDDDIPF